MHKGKDKFKPFSVLKDFNLFKNEFALDFSIKKIMNVNATLHWLALGGTNQKTSVVLLLNIIKRPTQLFFLSFFPPFVCGIFWGRIFIYTLVCYLFGFITDGGIHVIGYMFFSFFFFLFC